MCHYLTVSTATYFKYELKNVLKYNTLKYQIFNPIPRLTELLLLPKATLHPKFPQVWRCSPLQSIPTWCRQNEFTLSSWYNYLSPHKFPPYNQKYHRWHLLLTQWHEIHSMTRLILPGHSIYPCAPVPTHNPLREIPSKSYGTDQSPDSPSS